MISGPNDPGGQAVDPSRFNDALALRTDWAPLPNRGYSGMRLTEDRDKGLLFYKKGVVLPVIMSFAFFAASFLVAFVAYKTWQEQQAGGEADMMDILVNYVLVVLVFAGIAVAFIVDYFSAPKVLFDYTRSAFWDRGEETPFSEIYALQIVVAPRRTRNGGYVDFHQVNLVLRDGRRKYVEEYESLSRARREAETIRTFIGGGKHLWDATQG